MPNNEGALTQSEAETFIETKVRSLLKQYFLILVAVLGIPNLIALFGIWVSVKLAATDVATLQAREIAEKTINSYRIRFDELTGFIKNRSEELNRLNTELLSKTGEQKERLRSVNTEVQALQKVVENLRNADLARVAEIVNLLNQSTNTEALIVQFKSLHTQTTNLANQVGALTVRAVAVDSALDMLGQAGQGGVWNILFNRLNIPREPNFLSYHDWMGSIAISAKQRLTVDSNSPNANPVKAR